MHGVTRAHPGGGAGDHTVAFASFRFRREPGALPGLDQRQPAWRFQRTA